MHQLDLQYHNANKQKKKKSIEMDHLCTPESQFQNLVFWFSVSLNEIYGKKIIETQFT